MKFLRSERLLVFGIAAVLLLSMSAVQCGGNDPELTPREPEQLIAQTVVAQDDGTVLGLFFIDSGEVNNDSDPLITIKNSLDRNIKIDLDGTSHHEISLGDNKETKKTFTAGEYKIMISAGSLKFVPGKNKVVIENDHEYRLLLRRIPVGTEYNYK